MKFGFRVPSLRTRIAARTSWKRVVRNSLGVKAPRGWGWVTNPSRAAYDRIYNRTTVGLGKGCVVLVVVFAAGAVATVWACTRGAW
jgi:hypothetical protein